MKKVLIVADKYGTAQLAIQRGIDLANNINSTTEEKISVTIVAFSFEHLNRFSIALTPEAAQDIQQTILDKRTGEIDAALENADPEDIQIDIQIIWEKDVATWLLEYLNIHNYDLLIKSGNRSESFFYSSTDWLLIRNCPCPFMILCKNRWRSKHNVLAAIDLDTKSTSKQALNEKVIEQAKFYNQYIGKELYAAYIVPVSSVLNDLGLVFADEEDNQAQKTVLPRLRKYVEQRGLSAKNAIVRAGDPSAKLTSTAHKLGADLVVLGCVGHTGLSGKIIGNTAEKILTHLKSDVLVLKP
ncbi:universal stress protein [Flocculibacter collagenilyticus]|uniref:universal stress protein n=1 Tax=Flocculibacter collagenilyticus TaxID=2744479 RepID=UPI0018F4AB30|nr:universal stress protein [Flocculibacter collagenilyticus]